MATDEIPAFKSALSGFLSIDSKNPEDTLSPELHEESLFAPLEDGGRLHLKRFFSDKKGPPVLFLHGAIENGRIFYSRSRKGLAPFLARAGCDCYVGELRGRGGSLPPIFRGSSYGQTEAIKEEIPAMARRVREVRGEISQHWVAHSWGGVLMASTLVRYPQLISSVDSLVFWGTKRTVKSCNCSVFLYIHLIWNRLCPALARVWGYLPARELGIGSDNETIGSLRHSVAWVKPSPWVDPDDGFSYGQAAEAVTLPPALLFVGGADPALGNPMDVRAFAAEMGSDRCHMVRLSRSRGFSRDYGHIDMVTHPMAVQEVFPTALSWLEDHS